MHDHEHEHDEACGCGHEHHHEHEHEHHHEHEHEHGEACGCGCEQEHHHHDHGAGCDCAECTAKGFRLTKLEGATAAAVRFSMPGPQGRAEVEIVTRVKALSAEVLARGGLVGHIKGAVTAEPEVTTFSCTGGGVTLGRKDGAPVCTVDLVAILLGLSDADIEDAVCKFFPEIEK